MAVRKDKVQISVAFLTDESKEYAKLVQENKDFLKDLRKAKKEGKDLSSIVNQIAQAGKKVGKIDLKKLAPAQLVSRARQLKQVLSLIPQSAPQYKQLADEYKAINDELAEMRQKTKGVSQAQSRLAASGSKAFQFIGKAIAAIGITQLGSKVITTTAQFEKMGAVLENALGSKSAAKQSLQLIQDFAAKTPFQVQEILDSYIKLVNRGFKPTQEELVKIGDLAASQGKDMNQLVEAILDAQVTEFERLKEFGIRASKSGDQVTLSFKGQEVQVKNTEDAIRNAILTFGELEGVQGTTAKIAETLQGRLSNLQDAFSNFLNTLGNSGGLGDAAGGVFSVLKDVLDEVTFSLSDAATKAKTLTDDFLDQKSKVEDLESTLNPLLTQYDELTGKSELTTEEQEELKKVIVQIGKITPKSIEEIDKYGNALSINADASRELLKAEQARLKFINKEQIKELENLKKNTEALIDVENRIIDRKDETLLGFELFSSERIGEAAKKIGEFRQDIEGIDAQLRLLKGEPTDLETAPTPTTKTGGDGGGGLSESEKEKLRKKAEERKKQKEKELEELRLLRLSATEKEIEDVEAKYARLIELAKKHNQDFADLETQRDEEIRQIRILSTEAATIEQREATVTRIESIENEETRHLEFLKKVNEERSENFRKTEEKKRAEAQRTADFRQAMEQATLQSASSFIQAGIDLLGRDEKARKRNAEKIKGAAKIKVALDLSQEIQGIWKNANSNITNSVIPGWAQAYAGIQTGFAIGRAAIQVSRINAQKFEKGGIPRIGRFGGSAHTFGGTKGYFDDGTQIEVEKDELFAIVNKRDSGLLGQLSQINSRHGRPFFNDGGLVGLNTTPAGFNLSPTINASSEVDLSELVEEFRMLRRDMLTQRSNLRAHVVLDELNAANDLLNSVEAEASL